jgi:hypothetical protein
MEWYPFSNGQATQAINSTLELLYSDVVCLRQADYQLTVEYETDMKATQAMYDHWMERLEEEPKPTNDCKTEILSSQS